MSKYDAQYLVHELQLFLYWISERYIIHINKDVKKLPQPWTDDIYLQTYSFTNVRRIEDKVSQYVVNTICNNSNLSLQDKLLNIIWFRIFNQPKTFELFNFPIYTNQLQGDFKPIHDKYAAMIPQDSKVKLSRGAYMNSGVMNAQYDDVKGYLTTMMPWHIIWKLYTDKQKFNLLMRYIRQNQGQKAFDIINGLRGIGQFLAYQIYIDLSYCKQVQFTQNDFVYLGPGAKRGVKIVFPNVPNKQYSQIIKYMCMNIDRLMKQNLGFSLRQLMVDLPLQQRRISLSNMQNCFCEFSKYRVLCSGQKKKILKYGRNL